MCIRDSHEGHRLHRLVPVGHAVLHPVRAALRRNRGAGRSGCRHLHGPAGDRRTGIGRRSLLDRKPESHLTRRHDRCAFLLFGRDRGFGRNAPFPGDDQDGAVGSGLAVSRNSTLCVEDLDRPLSLIHI